ncbi:MAG: flavodoxin domain-containing protein [Anaerolineae bacterium]
MAKRVLVTYATMHGSTAEAATVVAEVLRQNGMDTDVRPIGEVQDLSGYGAVVLGSAVKGNKVLPKALQFVSRNRQRLAQIPVAYFSLCIGMQEPSEDRHEWAKRCLEPLGQLVPPVAAEAFAGKLDYSKVAFVPRTAMRMGGLREGDYRNWDAIRSWAAAVAGKLKQASF